MYNNYLREYVIGNKYKTTNALAKLTKKYK